MCANIFDVSKFALENGEIKPRIKRAELQFNLDKLLEQYNEAVKLTRQAKICLKSSIHTKRIVCIKI